MSLVIKHETFNYDAQVHVIMSTPFENTWSGALCGVWN